MRFSMIFGLALLMSSQAHAFCKVWGEGQYDQHKFWQKGTYEEGDDREGNASATPYTLETCVTRAKALLGTQKPVETFGGKSITTVTITKAGYEYTDSAINAQGEIDNN